jgi:hypothetical protein
VYGREADFEEKAETAITKMGKKQAKSYRTLRKAYQETGDDEARVSSICATWSSPTGTKPALYIKISALCNNG